MENPVLIFGANALGKVALDIFISNQVEVYGFLDDNAKLHGTLIEDFSVFGSTESEDYLKLLKTETEAFIATDDNRLRKSIVKNIVENYKKMPVNAIHQQAYVEPSASIGHGNLIAVRAVIASHAKVGHHCILNAGAMIDYEAELGDFVQVGANSVVGSQAKIGEGTFIGAGVTIVSGIKIGKNARIGAGSLVIQDVADNETVFGVPAKKV
jgi:sugar O-acyltransferase (sialic acid O-acetyltransferase NeuD family)